MDRKEEGASSTDNAFELIEHHPHTEKTQVTPSQYEPTAALLPSDAKLERKKSYNSGTLIAIAMAVAVMALILALVALTLVVAFREFPKQQEQVSSQLPTSGDTQDSQALQTQLNSLSEQVQAMQSQLSNYNQVLQSQLTNYNQALQSQLTSHNQQIQQLQSQQSDSNQQIQQLQSQQSDSDQQIQQLQSQQSDSDQEIQQLQSQQSDSDQEIGSLQSQQASYHQESQALQIQIEQLNETASRPGPPGPPGPAGPASGGVLYTRWGSSSCPNINGTELVYNGTTAGNRYGGGANYLCMPEDPEYTLPFRYSVQGYSSIYKVEYAADLQSSPCVVCVATTRETVLMIPAKTSCPSAWTREYYGYLMSGHYNEHRRMYECVDQEATPTANTINDAAFYHTEIDCASGLPCPPYTTEKEVNCVVCTK